MHLFVNHVWIFNGENGRFSSGVFSSKEKADSWIEDNCLTGVLTLYPVDKGVYDWAIENGHFVPEKVLQKEPSFIQKFTSASQEHYHYENGKAE